MGSKSVAILCVGLVRLLPVVKRIDFVSDRLSYIVLRGRWLHIILVNLHAPSEEKVSS